MSVDAVSTGRALRIGVAGPVGTGKSSLIATLCRELAGELGLAVVTNDIYTDEDARFIREQGVLAAERIEAVQTGCCPHTAIRDDISANLLAAEELERVHGPLDVVFVESGGDNLTAAFSPALADTQIFVLDCAGGDDVPRKGGPGIARSDLLVINKTDLDPYVGADADVMIRDATAQRDGLPVIAGSLRDGDAVGRLTAWIHDQLKQWRNGAFRAWTPDRRLLTVTPTITISPPAVTRAAVTICAEASGGRTVISELSGTEPWRPRIVSGHSGIAAVALVQTRASLIAGDDVALSITVGAGARLEVTELGAMLAHDVRRGPAVSLRTEIAVGCGGVLTWVGKPLIAGDGSSTVRTTSVALSGSGQALLGEALVLGRARETPGALTARIRLTADAEAVLDETLDTRDLDTLRSPIVAGNASMISSLTLGPTRRGSTPRSHAGPRTGHAVALGRRGGHRRADDGGTGRALATAAGSLSRPLAGQIGQHRKDAELHPALNRGRAS